MTQPPYDIYIFMTIYIYHTVYYHYSMQLQSIIHFIIFLYKFCFSIGLAHDT